MDAVQKVTEAIERLRSATRAIEAESDAFAKVLKEEVVSIEEPDARDAVQMRIALSRTLIEVPLRLLVSTAGLMISVSTKDEADALKTLVTQKDLTTPKLAQGLCTLIGTMADSIDTLARTAPGVH